MQRTRCGRCPWAARQSAVMQNFASCFNGAAAMTFLDLNDPHAPRDHLLANYKRSLVAIILNQFDKSKSFKDSMQVGMRGTCMKTAFCRCKNGKIKPRHGFYFRRLSVCRGQLQAALSVTGACQCVITPQKGRVLACQDAGGTGAPQRHQHSQPCRRPCTGAGSNREQQHVAQVGTVEFAVHFCSREAPWCAH